MAKRFTDSDKWQDKWFRKLPTRMKLLWCFMLDSCDNAGIYEVDLELFHLLTGEAVSEEEYNTTFENRIFPLGNDKVWIKKFVLFQYGILSEDSRPHKVVLESLKKHGVYKEYLKGIQALARKEKDKDKEKDPNLQGGSGEGGARAFFDLARKSYPGTKGGLTAEWTNFEKKYGDEIEAILPVLAPAIQAEKAFREKQKAAGQFVPPWKNFQTWINRRCWEQELGETGGSDGSQNGSSGGHGAHGGNRSPYQSAQQRRDERIREILRGSARPNGGAKDGDNPGLLLGAREGNPA